MDKEKKKRLEIIDRFCAILEPQKNKYSHWRTYDTAVEKMTGEKIDPTLSGDEWQEKYAKIFLTTTSVIDRVFYNPITYNPITSSPPEIYVQDIINAMRHERDY